MHSSAQNDSIYSQREQESILTVKKAWVPLSMIAIGAIGIQQNDFQSFNREIREETDEFGIRSTRIDDPLAIAPGIAVYALDLFGVKGKNKIGSQSILHFSSLALTAAIVLPTKSLTNSLRPDGSNGFSFPSGHTAIAFANAEFLRQEYGHRSPWYGIAGYTMAASVAFLRITNDKHWFNDVVAGAGIGILSTQIVYWAHDRLKRKKLNKENAQMNFSLSPAYVGQGMGLSLRLTL